MFRRYPTLSVLMVIGLAAALLLLWARHRLESAYRTVEIVLDGEEWTVLAQREGVDADAYLRDLRAAGAVSVAAYDGTLRRWNAAGLVGLADGGALAGDAALLVLNPDLRAVAARGLLQPGRVIVAARPEVREVARAALAATLGPGRVEPVGSLLVVRGRLADVQEIGLGYLPQDLARWERLGFTVVLRPRNARSLTETGLDARFAVFARVPGARTLIFEGNEVLGFEGLIDRTAALMRRGDYRFGRVEIFSAQRRQKGEDRLAAQLRPAVVRVFSITPEEMATLELPEAVAKVTRSPRERNIRILYLRPFLQLPAGTDSLAVNRQYVQAVASDVRAAGFAIGRAQPLPPLALPRGLVFVAALGALAAVAMLVGELARGSGRPIAERWLVALAAAGLLASVGLRLAGPAGLWRQLLALGISIAAPTLAVLFWFPRPADAARSPGDVALRSAGVLWAVSLASLAGGLIAAAVLSEWSFMLAASVFVGVKLAHVVPIALVGLFLAAREDRTLWRHLTEIGDRPLLVKYALLVLVAGAAALFVLARTGNISVPLLGLEERLRNAVETWLVARPRTKEYLLGHPAMILAAAAALAGARRWVVPLAMVGAIGQVGLVNSFSHIHTPIAYTLWRTANGLALGTIIGLAALAVLWPAAARLGWVRVEPAAARAPTA